MVGCVCGFEVYLGDGLHGVCCPRSSAHEPSEDHPADHESSGPLQRWRGMYTTICCVSGGGVVVVVVCVMVVAVVIG